MFQAADVSLWLRYLAALVEAAGAAMLLLPGFVGLGALVLAVDPATLAIRGLVTIDAQGGTSTFAFSNLKQNVGLADNQFTFKIPRGVDVVSDTPRS